MDRHLKELQRRGTVYTIYRVEKDGTRSVVTCVDDRQQIGVEIYADRDRYDWEPKGYEVEMSEAGDENG